MTDLQEIDGMRQLCVPLVPHDIPATVLVAGLESVFPLGVADKQQAAPAPFEQQNGARIVLHFADQFGEGEGVGQHA